jgi:hypothetical protein
MINHNKQFIFIHIPKCGGTSVETALLNTYNNGEQLLKRKANYKGRFEFNFLTRNEQIDMFGATLNKSPQHWKLRMYKPVIQQSYYTFTFVRNPWDLVVSEYRYFKKMKPKLAKNMSFEQFVIRNPRTMKFHLDEQHTFINEHIDYIGRMETLNEDFKNICDELYLENLQLPQVNVTNKHKIHYTEYYSNKSREIIQERYKKDIDIFEYSFGE